MKTRTADKIAWGVIILVVLIVLAALALIAWGVVRVVLRFT